MNNFLDRVDKALLNGGITSNPLVENFVHLISEASQNSKILKNLETWVSDDHDIKTSDLPAQLLKKRKFGDGNILSGLSDLISKTGNDPAYGLGLVNKAIVKLYSVDLSKHELEDTDLDLAVKVHIKNLGDLDEELFKDNEDFSESVTNFIDMAQDMVTMSPKLRESISTIQANIRTHPDDLDDDDDDEDYSDGEDWETNARAAAASDEEEDLRDSYTDEEKAGIGDALQRKDEVVDAISPGDRVADQMDADEDPGEALRKKMLERDPSLAKPPGGPEEDEDVEDEIEANQRQNKDLEPLEPGEEDLRSEIKSKIAKDRVQIVRQTDDKILVRIKAIKRDKKIDNGKPFRTYRFATFDQDPADDPWTQDSIWEHLKTMSKKAQSDPQYAKQYNRMFSTNLKDAYGSLDNKASTFREYLRNFVGEGPRDGLLRAYSRNDPHDKYRLSGVVSALDDNIANRIASDLRPRMKIDGVTKWLFAAKRAYEGEDRTPLGESIEFNVGTLNRALLSLNEELDKELAELATSVLSYNAVAKEIMRNPAMLEKYGIEVPDFAKTRDDRFKQWLQKETGKGNINWGPELTKERKDQYMDMFTKQDVERPAKFQQPEMPPEDPEMRKAPEPWDKPKYEMTPEREAQYHDMLTKQEKSDPKAFQQTKLPPESEEANHNKWKKDGVWQAKHDALAADGGSFEQMKLPDRPELDPNEYDTDQDWVDRDRDKESFMDKDREGDDWVGLDRDKENWMDKDIDNEYEKSIQKDIHSVFSKLVKSPQRLEAFNRWASKEAKLGNLGSTEFHVAKELVNAAYKDKLPQYLESYAGEYNILKRISRLVRQI